ncbi:MAG: hypothetical protein HYZ57_14585 [Acidobacteria bacterium]|nr:hypothetical protein [Acidobacteriota bacterium]
MREMRRLACLLLMASCGGYAQTAQVRVLRLMDAPIITPALHPSIGENIQGPSLIRVPDWVRNPLGRYYLYFAAHKGTYIRLAYADNLMGPWKIHPPGSLQLSRSYFLTEPPPAPPGAAQEQSLIVPGSSPERRKLPHSYLTEATTPHIAPPDVHVDHANKRIIMYFHGLDALATQLTRAAVSSDGIQFKARPEKLGRTYLRAFRHGGATYGIAMPGQVYRSKDGLTGFEPGPVLFNPDMRHCALLERGNRLFVFWTQVGHAPERILLSTIDLSASWKEWKETPPVEVLRPERSWEGADRPVEPSMRSVAYGRVNQLRDPAIFEENGKIFLLYAVAGESGIAIAEVFLDG